MNAFCEQSNYIHHTTPAQASQNRPQHSQVHSQRWNFRLALKEIEELQRRLCEVRLQEMACSEAHWSSLLSLERSAVAQLLPENEAA
jgi:hypothetical protein